ncbi:SDR family oxidoreductase [Candidatus Sumerlaeota bacterium]|nr:SDR family oxidoreductase [Candidatus Sumerlaeota bacterium]
MLSLEGCVALITGGGGVLGGTIGKGLGLAGAQVAFTDLFEDKAQAQAEAVAGLGVETCGVAMDAFNPDSIRAGLERIEAQLGPVDILINAAGGNVKDATVVPENPFFKLPKEAIDKVVGLNLYAGAIGPCQIVGGRMAERKLHGSIINVSSMNAFRPLTRVMGYSAAKAAVSNFTQWLAVHFTLELKLDIRVNAIAPGFFVTEQNRALLLDGDQLTERGQQIISHTPMGRFGEPDDLIGACVWLASGASAFVNGVVLPIDGGFSAYSGV